MANSGKQLYASMHIPPADKYDLLATVFFFIAGIAFFWNSSYWAGITQMGGSQYGDAAFWWNGALHFAAGIIKDNPNLDFRMGYATLAGLFVAVLGGNFLLFHKFLIAIFLFVASALYFALKPTFGRVAAIGAIALLVINPFTAEWLAISTSDSTGLILNMAACSCLIVGLRNNLHLGLLAAFGFLLASASLTRPLMSPFIAAVILVVLLYKQVSWKKRIQGIAAMLTAFAVPSVLWVVFLHGITGSWAMAGHDSTTFYAASDPQIQVWNGSMYDKVQASAVSRHKTLTITPAQLSNEFWLLTRENYEEHLSYHFSRMAPHIEDIAKFSNRDMAKNNDLWDMVRKGIVMAVAISLALSSAQRKHWLRAGLLILLGSLTVFLPAGQSMVVLGGALLLAFGAFWPKLGTANAALAAYWWTGVAVLFFVGGTWGPPLGAVHGMNALGYRLGSQFFFVNDLIVMAMFGLISTFGLSSSSAFRPSLSGSEAGTLELHLTRDESGMGAPLFLARMAYVFIAGVICMLLAGGGIVGHRMWLRANESPQPFPALEQIQAWWQEKKSLSDVPLQTVSEITGLREKTGNTDSGGLNSPYLLFTGSMSDFVWNLADQERSQAIIYLQNNVSPLVMSPNLVYVEFPSHLREQSWTGMRGAWVLRRLADLPSKSNLPFYFSETSVKAFVPLAEDKMHFDISAARIFPLQKYATQLYRTGELKTTHGIVEWHNNSGAEKYPRRFLLGRAPNDSSSEPLVFELDISKALGTRSLSFKWALEKAPNRSKSSQPPTLKIVGVPTTTLESQGNTIAYNMESNGTALRSIQSAKIDLTQSKQNVVKLVVDGIGPDDKVWFYEFNMQSDEFLLQ